MRLRQAEEAALRACRQVGPGDVPQGHNCAESCKPFMWLVPMQVRVDRHALASRILLSVIDFPERQSHTARWLV